MEQEKQIKLDSSAQHPEEQKGTLLSRLGSYLNLRTQHLSLPKKRLLLGVLLLLMAGFFIYQLISGFRAVESKLQNSIVGPTSSPLLSDSTSREGQPVDSLVMPQEGFTQEKDSLTKREQN